MARRKDDYMTLKQASEATGIPEVTLRKAARLGHLIAEKLGGQFWVVTQAALDDWLNNPTLHRPGPKK
jgi:excisionase family DNA binding protein